MKVRLKMLTKKRAQGLLLNFRQYLDACLEFLKDDSITPDDAVSKVVKRADAMFETAEKESTEAESGL
jgi:hypothetical protein